MNDLPRWLAENGITIPSRVDALQAAIAGVLIFLALAIGLFTERRAGPIAIRFWKRHVAHHGEGLGPRLGSVLRHAVAALLLSIILNSYSWGTLAALFLGLAQGAAVARLAMQFLRGLGIPRWTAYIVGLVLFVGLLSHAIGGLDRITNVLNGIGFDIGRRRLSVLTLVEMLVTVVALLAGVRLANRVVAHSITQAKGFDPTQKLLAQKLASVAVVIAAFFLGIDLLDIDVTAFAVFGGALGLAVGFGLQKTVGNLIAGIILLMDRSIKPGDVIVVGDSFGWVNKIGVRAVSVVTRDGKEHLIPNENLMTEEVENWSYSDRNVRVRIPVGVSYDCDLKLAQQLMLRAATESPRVLKNPKPNVWLAEFGDSSVNHEILAWISDPESGVGNVKSDVLNRLWWLFKENGIDIPFPQRDVHVRSWSPPPSA